MGLFDGTGTLTTEDYEPGSCRLPVTITSLSYRGMKLEL
jgi:hypothetical protein